ALAAADELPVRVTALLLFGELDGCGEPAALLAGLREHRPTPATGPSRWRVAGVKLFADGIPPMRTAWLREPYLDGGRGGLLVAGRDEDERLAGLREMIRAGHSAGCQIGVHATGDRAVAETVRAFAAAAEADGAGRRHYVIHGDLIDPDTLSLMGRSGIGLNAQPRIREATAGMLRAALGDARAERTTALRSALAAGVPLCLSSDGPVLLPDWRADVAAAALRSRAAGVDERIGVAAALRAYTAAAAWQDGAESWKGTVEAGKVADLCVLDRDPLAVAAEQVPDLGIRMTLVAGRIAFDAGASPGGSSHRA
ncbi:MAG: amidohydrolase family protein, partial [Jatrophihabitantaceae bacterium]